MYKLILIVSFILFFSESIFAQKDSTAILVQNNTDSSIKKLNMDAVYNRPFLYSGKSSIAIGGYLEANVQYKQTEGIKEGFTFQAKRLTLFFSSTITRKIKFLSELEFEGGTKEINIEFAAMDVEFHNLFNLRGGIIMNPIGAFNQNHDGPIWDFIDRPITSTNIIPTTLSNAGFGFYGKHFLNNWIFGYETYLSNGFDDNIISNEMNRTSLSSGINNPSRFEASNNGMPMYTNKIAIRNRNIGELGVSYLTGVYNKWTENGLILDDKRSVSIIAFDFNSSFLQNRLSLKAEYNKVYINVPSTYTQQFGNEQEGSYLDLVYTAYNGRMLDWNNTKLNLGIRLEYVDYNKGKFKETGGNISDDIIAVVPTLAFRPIGSSVFRLNFRYESERDLFGNQPVVTSLMQFGFSTYF